MTDLNPQREQMADESMVRNLTAQAEAIWPQESALFARYRLPDRARILDAGCGTGEGSWRLAETFPDAEVLGVDILDHHLDRARRTHARFAPRLRFEHRSIFELGLPDATFDLVTCRHVVQSIPHPERVVAELVRVTRPGGWLHVIAEDYDMLHVARRGDVDPRDLWHAVVPGYRAAGAGDLQIGRRIAPLLREAGLEDVRVDYVIVDTLRVPRDTFARILEAWRDGYVDPIAEVTGWPKAKVEAHFAAILDGIRDPACYAVWMVPVAGGRVPRSAGALRA